MKPTAKKYKKILILLTGEAVCECVELLHSLIKKT